MSIERALITQAQPYMVAAKARDFIRNEITKGCRSEVSKVPVSLEPLFEPIWEFRKNSFSPQQTLPMMDDYVSSEDLVRLRVWISPEQVFEWNQSKLFIKQLQNVSFRLVFEVAGNNDGIVMSFLLYRTDMSIVISAFQGQFESFEITFRYETISPLQGLFGSL